MLETHQLYAAARDLVACRQRLAFAACFADSAHFALPDGVAARVATLKLPHVQVRQQGKHDFVTNDDHAMHPIALDACYELPHLPRIELGCNTHTGTLKLIKITLFYHCICFLIKNPF